MEAFFAGRGETEAFLKMQDEKINEENIKDMPEEDLKSFLPKYGDRIALRSFVTQRTKRKGNEKMSLLEKLRHKLKRNRREEDGAAPSYSEAGPSFNATGVPSANVSKNALKTQRMIEFGLMVYDASSHMYKPIRAKKGGGVRKTKVPKQSRKADLLKAGKEIFLNTQFGYGSPDDFECDIMDYKQVTLDVDITVGEIIDKTKLQKLRFYLALKGNTLTDIPADIPSDSDDSLPDLCRSPMTARKTSTVENNPVVVQPSLIQRSPISQSDVNEQTFLTSTPDNKHSYNLSVVSSDQLNLVEMFPLFYEDPEVSFGPTDKPSDTNATIPLQQDLQVTHEEITTEPFTSQPTTESLLAVSGPDATLEERTIHIRRGNCMADRMDIFSHDKVLQQVITVVRTLETGKKELGAGDGVVIDCLCEFWADFL